jgi:SPX domain protein involved in polyphosphate accumulation
MPGRVFLAALKNNLGTKKLQWIATSDIGHFAALAFSNPEEYNHKAIGLAGDELNVAEVSQAFKTALNYDQQAAFGFLGSILTTLVTEVGLMVRWFGSDGYAADIEKCRELHPGLKNFETWLKMESKFPK